MLVISYPSRFRAALYFFCHVLVLILSSYTLVLLTGFTQEYKTINLNKCITSHAKLLVYRVVGASSLAIGWYEVNTYLLFNLLGSVTLGTVSPFCDLNVW
jgi:hypothetical protein